MKIKTNKDYFNSKGSYIRFQLVNIWSNSCNTEKWTNSIPWVTDKTIYAYYILCVLLLVTIAFYCKKNHKHHKKYHTMSIRGDGGLSITKPNQQTSPPNDNLCVFFLHFCHNCDALGPLYANHPRAPVHPWTNIKKITNSDNRYFRCLFSKSDTLDAVFGSLNIVCPTNVGYIFGSIKTAGFGNFNPFGWAVLYVCVLFVFYGIVPLPKQSHKLHKNIVSVTLFR